VALLGLCVLLVGGEGVVVEVDGFEDLREIGRGGFSVVYEARQVMVGRPVALKVLSRIDLDEAAFARFEQECHAMGALSWHPHVVVVFDAGRTPGRTPYLAMELLSGGSLADRLRVGGPIDWREALTLGVQVADALAAAHAVGVLHRDIKPENILLDRFGNAKLADFGIASVQGSTSTATGIVTGTLAHTAPELLGGERASVASDVYSLGSTLYQLVAGSPAFVHATDENQLPILRRALDDPVPELRDRGVPDELASVIEWCMAKHPVQRPSSAGELARQLQGVQQGAGLPVTPVHDDPTGSVVPVAEVPVVETPPVGHTEIVSRPGREPTPLPPPPATAPTPPPPLPPPPTTAGNPDGPVGGLGAAVADTADLPVADERTIDTEPLSSEGQDGGEAESTADAMASVAPASTEGGDGIGAGDLVEIGFAAEPNDATDPTAAAANEAGPELDPQSAVDGELGGADPTELDAGRDQETPALETDVADEDATGRRRRVLVGIAAAAALILGLTAVAFATRGGEDEAATETASAEKVTTTSTASTTTTSLPPPTDAAPVESVVPETTLPPLAFPSEAPSGGGSSGGGGSGSSSAEPSPEPAPPPPTPSPPPAPTLSITINGPSTLGRCEDGLWTTSHTGVVSGYWTAPDGTIINGYSNFGWRSDCVSHGTRTFSVTVFDAAGNSKTVSKTYTIL
jgi:serine/threonine protein kinase